MLIEATPRAPGETQLVRADAARVVRWLTIRDIYYGWLVVAVAFLTIGVTFGTRAAFGVLLVALVDSMNWSRSLVAGAIAVNGILWAVGALTMGGLLDRYGPRRVYAAAALLAGLGLAVAAGAQEPWQLYLGIGVLAGVGLAPLMPVGQAVVVANWFMRRRGLAAGLMASGTGLGILVLAPVTEWVVRVASWQLALMVLALLFSLGLAPLIAVVQRGRPEDCGLRHGDLLPGMRGGAAEGPRLGVVLRAPRFWLLGVGCLLGVVEDMFLVAHQTAYLVDAGVGRESAALVLGIGGAAATLAMLLWGWVADRWGSEYAYLLGSLCFVAAISLLLLLGPIGALLLPAYTVLFALGFGSRMGLFPVMGAALARGPAFGAVMGIVGLLIGIGAALGPALGGWVFDRTGSYAPALFVLCVSAVTSGICMWLAAPRRGRLGAAGDPLPLAASGR